MLALSEKSKFFFFLIVIGEKTGINSGAIGEFTRISQKQGDIQEELHLVPAMQVNTGAGFTVQLGEVGERKSTTMKIL